jgi:hypothetical protein
MNTQIGLRKFQCHVIVVGIAVGGGATAWLCVARVVVCCWRCFVQGPSDRSNGAALPRPETGDAVPHCLNCGERLMLDDLWGWVHYGGRYLCRDETSGELLCQPATLI